VHGEMPVAEELARHLHQELAAPVQIAQPGLQSGLQL
jgi:hypothetical protein